MYIIMYIHVHVYNYAHTCTCTYMYMYIIMYLHVHVYNYVHTCNIVCTSKKGYAIILETYFHLQIHVFAFCTEKFRNGTVFGIQEAIALPGNQIMLAYQNSHMQ